MQTDSSNVCFSQGYKALAETADGCTWELFQKDDFVMAYLLRPFRFEGEEYFDAITPYVYTGLRYEKRSSYIDGMNLFCRHARERKIVTLVVRQPPHSALCSQLEPILTELHRKTTYGIGLSKGIYVHPPKTRNLLKKARKQLVCQVNDSLDEGDLSDFELLYRTSMRDKGHASDSYYMFTPEYFRAIEKLPRGQAALIEARCSEGGLQSATILLVQGDVVDYHLAASSGAGRKVGGMNLVQDEAIRYCIRRGAKLYHLGGGLKEKDTLATFKEKMANLELSYVTYGKVLLPAVYDMLPASYDSFPKHIPPGNFRFSSQQPCHEVSASLCRS